MTVHLGIDTATAFLSVGLWREDEGLIAGRAERVVRGHGSRLLQLLDELMRECGIERGDLATVSVGCGPGSYTGLKVGAAAGRGLARALALPFYGCDTLAAIAFTALADGAEGYAALDARRGNVYVGRYRRGGDTIETLEEPRKAHRDSLPPASLAALIEGVAPDPGFLARSGLRGAPFEPVYL